MPDYYPAVEIAAWTLADLVPSPELVKVLVEHFGWPLITVAVCVYVIYRTFGKHEAQMTQITAVNEQIVLNLKNVADLMARHDYDELQRHAHTQASIERRRL